MTNVRFPSLFGVLIVAVAAGLSMEPRLAFGVEPAPIPPLDKLLAQAMDSHPKIIAAQAKVALAQAQLQVLRFQVAQEIIDMNAERTGLALSLDYHKRVLNEMMAAEGKSRGAFSRLEMNKAEQAVLEAQTRAAKVDLQLRQILGSVGGAASGPAGRGSSSTPAPAAGVASVPEDLNNKEASLQLLGHPCKLAASDMPLRDVAAYLQDSMSKFGLSSQIFVDEALVDMPITVNVAECEHFADAIQAVEDSYPKIKFVVREYGLFITTAERARRDRFWAAIDFWTRNAYEYQRIDEAAGPKRNSGPAAKPTSPATKPAAKPAVGGSASDPFAPAAKPVTRGAASDSDPFGAPAAKPAAKKAGP